MATEETPACPKCGVPSCELHCGVRKRQGDRGPCTQRKGWGTDHLGIGACKAHLGNTANHQTAAAGEKARRAVAEFAARRDVEPTEALLEVLGLRAGMVAFLAGRIADMERDAELTQADGELALKPSVWVEMYDTALREYGRIAKACADAKIDERRIRIEESMGRQLSEVIRRVLDGVVAGLTEAGVAGEVLEEFMRAQVPGIVRAALATLVLRRPPDPPAARA